MIIGGYRHLQLQWRGCKGTNREQLFSTVLAIHFSSVVQRICRSIIDLDAIYMEKFYNGRKTHGSFIGRDQTVEKIRGTLFKVPKEIK